MRKAVLASFVLLSMSLAWVGPLRADSPPAANLFARPFDPVVIAGSKLGDFTAHSKAESLYNVRLMVVRGGAWSVVPFQIDEKTRLVKIGGVKNDLIYKSKPVYVTNYRIVGADDVLGFDDDDEIVFMARDAGDRADRANWPSNAKHGVEIEIGADGATAYAYLFLMDNPPPLSPTMYIRYDEARDEVRSESYRVSYARRDPQFFASLAIPESNGGADVNMVDGEKYRTRVRVFGGIVDYFLTNMDYYADLLGVKAGPIRVIRRVDAKLEFWMFAGRYHEREIFYYPNHFEYLVDMKHHSPVPQGMYDLSLRVTVDLSGEAKGSTIRSSRNPGGALADGSTDDAEKKMDYGPSSWVAVNGPKGRWIQQMALPSSAGKKVWPDLFYLDDSTRIDKPERVPGQLGNAGAIVKHMQKIAKGPQWVRMAYYFPPAIDDANVANSMNVLQNPVVAKIGAEGPANALREPAVINPDTRTGPDAPEASYVLRKEDTPTKGYFPQIMIDPNLGNGTGLGYVDRNLFGNGMDIDSFFILSDRMFFVSHIILNEWPFVSKNDDLKLWIEYQDHPNRFFFGLGNDSPERSETIYHWQQTLVYLSYKHRISETIGVKGTIGFKNTEIGPGKWFSGNPKPPLQEGFGYDEDIVGERYGETPYGIEGGMSNYVQFAFFHDGRDEWFNPHKGHYEEVRIDWVSKMFGSDYDFLRIGVEVKGLWSPKFLNRSDWYPNNSWAAKILGTGKDVVFAARIAADRIEAPRVDFAGRTVYDIPFFEQSYIGDSFNNRGYYWARYIDRDRLYLNVEYRAVLWKMWVLVLFYDTGRVFDDMLDGGEWKNTSWESYHHTVGVGLRGVFPAQLMMRLDYGFSSEHPGGIMYGNAYHTF